MIPRMKLAAGFAFICCLLAGAASTGAQKDNCQNVQITITNNTGRTEIRVKKFLYWDADIGDWRHEYTWLPLWIPHDESRTRTRNLEHVDDDTTRIKIIYDYRPIAYAKDYYVETSSFVCRDGCVVHIDVTAANSHPE